jgi:queuine/archaeosine tRNA-ribosyltransferase
VAFQVSCTDWKRYITACKPDLAIVLSDTPFTTPPHSQKRITKSIERSATWLIDFLQHHDRSSSPMALIQMVGGIVPAARRAFAETLVEKVYGPEAELVQPLQRLDDGLAGYVFDLLPLHQSLTTANTNALESPQYSRHDEIAALLKASLDILPCDKLRLVNSAGSPHEMLRLIRDVGIDFFESKWAQRAADIGIALDFTFPANDRQVNGRKKDVGHNLYDTRYSEDFSQITDSFIGEVCPCRTCTPVSTQTETIHCLHDGTVDRAESCLLPYTRSYLHHLLMTHEMSAHALLAMHNLAVLDAMLKNVRTVATESGVEGLSREIARFEDVYDENMTVFLEAEVMWHEVDKARGKGRFNRFDET